MERYLNQKQTVIDSFPSIGIELVDLDAGEVDTWKALMVAAAQPYFLDVCPETGKDLINKLKVLNAGL